MNEVYTHGHHDSVLRSHRTRTVADSAAYLAPHLRPDMALLDVGCGPGSITHDLYTRVGRVRGIDVVEAPLAEARAAGEGPEFAVDDVYALSDPDDAYDVVHAHQVLQHLTEPVAALREMRRVARPGGIVAARDADYAAFTWWPADPRLDAWLALYRAVAHGNGAEPDAGRRILGWAHAAGFTDVTPSASVWCYATPDARTAWGSGWAERVRSSALAGQALDRGLATRAELDDIAAAWRDWAGHPDGWFVVPHGEILARA